MKKRINKKTSLLVMMFVCLFAVVSIGSAAWLLIGEDTEEVTGSVSVDTVEDQRHVITIDESTKDLDVVLVPESEINTSWFKYEPKEGLEQDFNAQVDFTVSNSSTAKVSITVTIGSEVAALVKNEILAVTVKYDGAEMTKAEDSYTYTAEEVLSDTEKGGSVTIVFEWGTKFQGLLDKADGSAEYEKVGDKTVSVSDKMLEVLTSLQALQGETTATVVVATSSTYGSN